MKETTWKSYEETARYLIRTFREEFGLDDVEGKQHVEGRSGATWEIEGKGVWEGKQAFFIIECRRRTTSKLNQESLGGLAFRITDTGAAGGIVVSPLGLQRGAALVAKSQGIVPVRLTPESTKEEYVMEFLDKVRLGVTDRVGMRDGLTIQVIDRAGRVVEGQHYEW